MQEPLVTVQETQARVGDDAVALLDCRFDLADPRWGEHAYREAHIPGAIYASLDRDLSGPVAPASGRHPLPEIARLIETLSGWGIDETVSVIAYDQGNGA